jgi:uncharacterized membrane protein YphA (DoxX/SURF4 family)
MTRIEPVLRAVYAGLFFLAGGMKVADPERFAVAIARLRAVPFPLIGPVAILIPWIELTAAAALFVPSLRRPALFVLLALLGAATSELLMGLALGATSCGCFGVESRLEFAIPRNLVLIGVGLYLSRPTAQSSPRVISST